MDEWEGPEPHGERALEESGAVGVREPRDWAEPAPASAGRRPLRRRAADKLIAGVAGGLADHFGVSALGVRIAFGIATLVVAFLLVRPWTGFPSSGLGHDPRLSSVRVLVKLVSGLSVLAYLALWILVPSEDAGLSVAARARRRLPRLTRLRSWLGLLALILGGSLLGAQIGLWSPDVIWAFLLIGFGVMLFRRDAERATGAKAAGPPEAGGHPAAVAPPSMPAPASSTSPAALSRERSPLGWLVLGIALLWIGSAAILQNLGALDLRLVRYPAMALLVLGAGMMVGAFAGRARWLVLPALVLVPIVLFASVIRVPLEGGIHDVNARGSLRPSYRVMAGTISLDLADLQGSHVVRDISASTGFGQINVVVPFDAHVIAAGRAGVGMIMIGPASSDRGLAQTLRRVWEPRYGDGPTITLDLQTGVGDIWVYRRDPTRKQLRHLAERGPR